MFDLDSAIHEWRNDLAHEGQLSRSDLDELEDHLRSAYQSDIHSGLQPALAFERARDDIGAVAELSAEFAKVERVGWRRFLVAGWVTFAVSFLLPVHRDGISLFNIDFSTGEVPGFEAFAFAISGDLGFLGLISALTNFFLLGTLWRIADRDRNTVFALAGIMTAATFLNLWWITQGFTELLIGYYAWWGSFASIATGLILRARELVKQPTVVPTN